jgi:hypothetical protein
VSAPPRRVQLFRQAHDEIVTLGFPHSRSFLGRRSAENGDCSVRWFRTAAYLSAPKGRPSFVAERQE